MKTKKQISNIVQKAINVSFNDGKLMEKKALSIVNLFKSQLRLEAVKLLSEYLKRLKLIINATTMTVESVIPLSQKNKLDLKKNFCARFKIQNTVYKLNPSLLGGLRVKIGDHVFEDSFASRIAQIGEVIRG